MGIYDTVVIPIGELPGLKIFEQLGIDFNNLDLQTKDFECNSDRYGFRRCRECGLLAMRDSNNNIYGITRVFHVHGTMVTTDGIEKYWVEYGISIRSGIVEFIVVSKFYKLGNITGHKMWKNSIPLDKRMEDAGEV